MIKILFLAANPMDTPRLRLDEEAHAIEAALRSAEYGERFHLVTRGAVRVAEIPGILLREKPHIVHFSGHGSSANEIILQDEQGIPQSVSAAALTNLFSILKDNLRCVVFSACYTAIQGQSVAEQVDCVIGMSKEIGDTSAIKFSAAFYLALGSGRDVQMAFNLGCAQLELEREAGADVPQLFANNIAANSITLASSAVEESALVKKFSILQREIERNKSIFAEPNSFQTTYSQILPGRVFWIIGPPGIGKRTFALALAQKWLLEQHHLQDDGPIFSVQRPIEWASINQSNIRNTAIILPDTLGPVSFDREGLDIELISLERLAQRGNLVIATSPDDVFAEARMRTRRFTEWLSTFAYITPLLPESYSNETREIMFRNLLQYAYDSGALSPHQNRLAGEVLEGNAASVAGNSAARDALGQAHALLLEFLYKTCIPVDIDRFIFTSLPSARTVRDFVGLLLQGADIDSRIHTWFGTLDPATQSFVFTLALFAGLNDRSLWQKYKEVVQHLLKLNPVLSIMPLGILRQHAAPYVTTVGPIDFVDSSAYRAIIHEISRSYREYFIELTDQLKKWTTPPEEPSSKTSSPSPFVASSLTATENLPAQTPEQPSSDSEESKKALANAVAETEPLRNAVARVVGEVAKQSLDDVSLFLKEWGSHRSARVGRAVGLALSETVTDPISGEAALDLLHGWAVDFSSGNARSRRRSAAAAFGQIGSILTRPDLQAYALQDLQLLAGDRDDYIRSEVAFFASRLAGSLPLSRIKPVLSKLATVEYREYRLWVYRDVARAIDLIVPKESSSALSLIKSWITSNATTTRQAGGYMLLSCSKLEFNGRHAMLRSLMADQSTDFVKALMLSISGDDRADAWRVLGVLTSAEPRGSRQQFIEALANASMDSRSDMKSLRSSLQEGLPEANIPDLLFDADTLMRCREIEQLIQDNPIEVVEKLAGLFDQQPDLAYTVIARLAQEPPDGIRPQLIRALTDGAPNSPTRYAQIITQLAVASDVLLSQIPAEVNDLLYSHASDLWMRFILDLISKHPEEVVAQLAQLLVSPIGVSSLRSAEAENVGRLLPPDRLPNLTLSVIARLAQRPPTGIHQELIEALAAGVIRNPKAYSDVTTLLVSYPLDDLTRQIPKEVDDLVYHHAVEAWTRYIWDLTLQHPDQVTAQLAQLQSAEAENVGRLIPPARLSALTSSVITQLAQMPPAGIHQTFVEALANGAERNPTTYLTLAAQLASSNDLLVSQIPIEVDIVCHNRRVDRYLEFLEGLLPTALLNALKSPFRKTHPSLI